MKDFNFFEGYYKRKVNIKANNMGFIILSCILIILLISYPLINLYRLNKLEGEIAVMKNTLEGSKSDESNEAIEEKKQSLNSINLKLKSLKEIDDTISENELINEYLVYTITSAVPEDVFLKSINITEGDIRMEGVARNQSSIAKLQYNLRSLDSFHEIFIPSISNDEGLYSFSVAILLQDVVEDEVE